MEKMKRILLFIAFVSAMLFWLISGVIMVIQQNWWFGIPFCFGFLLVLFLWEVNQQWG
jgi:hypothetical protein